MKSLKTHRWGEKKKEEKKQTIFHPLLPSLTQELPLRPRSVLSNEWRGRQGRWGQGSDPRTRRSQFHREDESTDACFTVAAPKILCSGNEARHEDLVLCESRDRKCPEKAKPYREEIRGCQGLGAGGVGNGC